VAYTDDNYDNLREAMVRHGMPREQMEQMFGVLSSQGTVD
jgi:hypothetical protein